jgi:hypothetical protein
MRKSSIAEKGNRARKSTSFQMPLDDNLNLIEDSYLTDSNDYINDFIEFKKKLEKRKKSTSSRRNSVNNNAEMLKGSANSTSTATNNSNNNNAINKLANASESKFRPITPRVFNYFPPLAKNNGHASDSNINLHMNKSDTLFNQKLPSISNVVKENLLTSRFRESNNIRANDSNNINGNGYKNLFFPILIRNYPNKNETYKSQNFVNKFKNYLDESSGIFWMHSLSHLKPKNVN